MIWTLLQAEADLRRRVVAEIEPGIRAVVQGPLSDPQRIALISLTYNIGLPAFRASTLMKMLNAKNYLISDDAHRRPLYLAAGDITPEDWHANR